MVNVGIECSVRCHAFQPPTEPSSFLAAIYNNRISQILNKKNATKIQVTYIYIIQNRKKDLSKFGVHFNYIHKTIYGACSIIFKRINLRCSDEKRSNLFRSNNVNLCTFCYYSNLFHGEHFRPYEISQDKFFNHTPKF